MTIKNVLKNLVENPVKNVINGDDDIIQAPYTGPELVVWLGSQYSIAGKLPHTVTLNGSDVSQWDDRNSSPLFVDQAVVAAQPAYNQNQRNGQPVFTNDGTEGLSGSGFPDISTCTIFAVGEFQTGDSTQALFDYHTGVTNSGFSLLHESGALRLRANTVGAGIVNAVYAQGLPIPFSIFECVVDGVNVTLYINGVQVATIPGGTLVNTLNSFDVMTLANIGFANVGDASEFLVYSSDIGNDNRLQSRRYLASEWGILL